MELSAEKLAVSAGISFRTIAGRNILFDEAGQRLFEINDSAAYIWCAVDDGIGYEAILHELMGQGLAHTSAVGYLESAVKQWIRLGFMKPASELTSDIHSGKARHHQDITLAGTRIRIRYATSLASLVAPIFAHLEVEGAVPNVVLDVVERGQKIDLLRNESWLYSLSNEEVATSLKGQLLSEVLEGTTYELALHAAALVRCDRILLVTGRPGAGKTTLTLALVDVGFGFAGDDLALLNSQGCVTGVPFAPAVKAGAWKLVAAYRPDIWDIPVFRRPDRRRVRYPAPIKLPRTSAYPLGWLVLLDRRSGAVATLTAVDPVSALRLMLEESYVPGRQLTTAGFEAVGHALDRASCYRLTYSRLEDAVELLNRTCR